MPRRTAKPNKPLYEQGIIGGNLNGKLLSQKPCSTANEYRLSAHSFCRRANEKKEALAHMKKNENYRSEIKSYVVRAGMTMSEVVDYLADEYGWSSSVPNLSGKLKRGSLRYGEAVELADALGYEIVWQKRREVK